MTGAIRIWAAAFIAALAITRADAADLTPTPEPLPPPPPIFFVHVGALGACFGLLVHAIVDFNLHIPSNALVFLLLAALATSQAPSSRLQNKA